MLKFCFLKILWVSIFFLYISQTWIPVMYIKLILICSVVIALTNMEIVYWHAELHFCQNNGGVIICCNFIQLPFFSRKEKKNKILFGVAYFFGKPCFLFYLLYFRFS